MRQVPPFTLVLLEAAIAVALMATTTPVAAQQAPTTAPPCACGPSALPSYTPPYPQPALRPLDGSPRSGVSYREGRGFQSARTSLGVSAFEPVAGPALFSGFYAGLHGGYGLGHFSVQDPLLGSTDARGGLVGLHAGHNWQSGAFVFGLEGDIDRTAAAGRRSFGAGAEVSAARDWSASLRGRAGYAFGPVLAYGTIGGAIAGHTTSVTLPGSLVQTSSGNHYGYVYGGGLEWQVTSRLTLRGEVLRYDFDERALAIGAGGTAPLKLDDTVVRGGLSYRFN